MAEAVGCAVWELLEDAPRWLQKYATESRRREPEPLPTMRQVERWSEWLPGSDGERYLTSRGIPLNVAAAARVGWDGRRLIFPMFTGEEIDAAKWRWPLAGAQMRSWAGEGRLWPLYPEPEPGWLRIVLVAGELDALRGRAAGLEACSVTCGAGHWREAWTQQLEGRRVVVCFDNNEVEQATERLTALRTRGVNAIRLDLRRLGLDADKGDLSDYLNGGGSVTELRAAVRRKAEARRTTVQNYKKRARVARNYAPDDGHLRPGLRSK